MLLFLLHGCKIFLFPEGYNLQFSQNVLLCTFPQQLFGTPLPSGCRLPSPVFCSSDTLLTGFCGSRDLTSCKQVASLLEDSSSSWPAAGKTRRAWPDTDPCAGCALYLQYGIIAPVSIVPGEPVPHIGNCQDLSQGKGRASWERIEPSLHSSQAPVCRPASCWPPNNSTQYIVVCLFSFHCLQDLSTEFLFCDFQGVFRGTIRELMFIMQCLADHIGILTSISQSLEPYDSSSLLSI